MKPANGTATIQPFWLRMPQFFAWPLQFGPMVYIGGLALASAVAYFLPLIGRLLIIVIWFLFFRYAMTVLVQTSRGNFDPDKADVHLESGDRRPVKQAAYMVISVVLLIVVAGAVGPKLAILVGIMMSLSLPAAIIIIAIDDSLTGALNPLRIFSVISSIGFPYLLLSLFLLLLQGGDAVVFKLIGPLIPDFIEYPVVTFVSMYFLLMMYNMMGYMVYQYHEELGFGIDKTFAENSSKKTADPNMSEADHLIAQLVADGDIPGAIDALLEDMRHQRNDIPKNQKLHRLYLTLGNAEKTLAHAQKLIGLLVTAGQADVAYELLVKVKALSADFAIPDASMIFPLADIAKRRHNAALALTLISGFDKKNPEHADIPDIYLLAAKIFAELKQDEAQAARILGTLISRYPESAATIEAKTYLSVLERTREAMKSAPTVATTAG